MGPAKLRPGHGVELAAAPARTPSMQLGFVRPPHELRGDSMKIICPGENRSAGLNAGSLAHWAATAPRRAHSHVSTLYGQSVEDYQA